MPMYIDRRLLPLFLLLAAGAVLSAAPDSLARDKPNLKDPPWHLTDYWFDFGEETEFKRYGIDLVITTPPPAGNPVAIAPISALTIDHSLYRIVFLNLSSKTGKPSLEFVRAGGGELKDVRLGEDAILFKGSENEAFFGAHLPFPWTKAHYTVRIRPAAKTKEGKTTVYWMGGYVVNHASGKEHRICSIRHEAEKPRMTATSSASVEWQGKPVAPDALPRCLVKMNNWRINGKMTTPHRVTAVYPLDVPQVGASKMQGTTVIAGIGRPVNRSREKGLFEQPTGFVRLLYTRPEIEK